MRMDMRIGNEGIAFLRFPENLIELGIAFSFVSDHGSIIYWKRCYKLGEQV